MWRVACPFGRRPHQVIHLCTTYYSVVLIGTRRPFCWPSFATCASICGDDSSDHLDIFPTVLFSGFLCFSVVIKGFVLSAGSLEVKFWSCFTLTFPAECLFFFVFVQFVLAAEGRGLAVGVWAENYILLSFSQRAIRATLWGAVQLEFQIAKCNFAYYTVYNKNIKWCIVWLKYWLQQLV